jgi:hypothetical protein
MFDDATIAISTAASTISPITEGRAKRLLELRRIYRQKRTAT